MLRGLVYRASRSRRWRFGRTGYRGRRYLVVLRADALESRVLLSAASTDSAAVADAEDCETSLDAEREACIKPYLTFVPPVVTADPLIVDAPANRIALGATVTTPALLDAEPPLAPAWLSGTEFFTGAAVVGESEEDDSKSDELVLDDEIFFRIAELPYDGTDDDSDSDADFEADAENGIEWISEDAEVPSEEAPQEEDDAPESERDTANPDKEDVSLEVDAIDEVFAVLVVPEDSAK